MTIPHKHGDCQESAAAFFDAPRLAARLDHTPQRFEAGRKQFGPLTLYVTRGIGPPEVSLWELGG